MKPVAIVIDDQHSPGWTKVRMLKPLQCNTELFTADQLRQAKVEVLREAWQKCECREQLLLMADEIERSKT